MIQKIKLKLDGHDCAKTVLSFRLFYIFDATNETIYHTFLTRFESHTSPVDIA